VRKVNVCCGSQIDIFSKQGYVHEAEVFSVIGNGTGFDHPGAICDQTYGGIVHFSYGLWKKICCHDTAAVVPLA